MRSNFHWGLIFILSLDKSPSGNSGTKTTVSTVMTTIMTGSIDSTSSIATPSETDMYASSKEELVTKLPGKLNTYDWFLKWS